MRRPFPPSNLLRRFFRPAVLFLCLCPAAHAQLATSDKMNAMAHGPFVSTTLTADPLNTGAILAYKAVVVDVGSDDIPAAIAFDTDLLRVASAWTGGFLHWYPARTSLQEFPTPDGFTHFATSQGPGWTHTGRFDDPRSWPYGPLPRDRARYHGLYLHGDRVVFSYGVGGTEVLESPGFTRVEGRPVFTRAFELSPGGESLSLRVLQALRWRRNAPRLSPIPSGPKRSSACLMNAPNVFPKTASPRR